MTFCSINLLIMPVWKSHLILLEQYTSDIQLARHLFEFLGPFSLFGPCCQMNQQRICTFPSSSERHNKIAMAAVCAGHLAGQTADWKYSFNQNFSSYTCLFLYGFIRLYNVLYAVSYGDKVSWQAVELAKLYAFYFPWRTTTFTVLAYCTCC